MIHKKRGEIEWLEFELFAEHKKLVHGVFLRHGGVSQLDFSSLNVSHGIGDNPVHVDENRKRVKNILGINQLITADHAQGTHIEHVTELVDEIDNCDGLLTNGKGWGLLAIHADCQAAMFYDPINEAIANVHAGWRGQVGNIYQKTIHMMQTKFGTNPRDLLVAISPSLGPENAEFVHYQKELPEEFWQFQVKPTYFDLWAIARYQLEKEGLLPHHIQIAGINTYACSTHYYSYRREKAKGKKEKITGNHGSVIAIV